MSVMTQPRKTIQSALSLLMCGLFLTCGPSKSDGQTTPNPATERIIGQLKALESKSLSERESAEEALEQMDLKDWDSFPTDYRMSSEMRLRVERIRQAVELRHAKSGTDGSTVTLADPQSLKAALIAISAQTGNAIADPMDPDAPVSIEVEDVPFWSALDQILDHANLDLQEFLRPEDAGLMLAPRIENRPPRSAAAYTGVFRIEPSAINARSSLLTPALSSVQVEMMVAWEPRLRPIRIALPMSKIKAVLEDGTSLVPENPDAEPEATAMQMTYQTELSVTLPSVDRDVKVIKELSGVLQVTLPGRTAKLELPLSSKEPIQRGAITLTLDGIREAGDLDEVRFRVKIDDPADSLQSHQMWIFDNEAYVVDSSGKRCDRLGLEVYRQTFDEVGISLLFELGEDAEKGVFHYETPLAIVASEWPFTLKELKLP